MTTGQILFYSGIGLLVLTIVLAIIFAIKKPQYKPGNAAYTAANGSTQKLRNGYPTDPLTIRREPAQVVTLNTVLLSNETEKLIGTQTEQISSTEPIAGTEVLPEGQPQDLIEKTVPLQQELGTAILQENFDQNSEDYGDV